MPSELLYGRRSAERAPTRCPQVDTTLTDTVILEDVEIHYALFEVAMDAALAGLPASVHPAVPAHLGITFWRCADGPLGAFECAWVGLACRLGIKPRHLVHAAFVTRAEVGDWLRRRYGFDCRVAEVRYRESYDRLHGRISVDGRVVLDTVTTRMQPVIGAGAAVKYSPALNPARIADSVLMVQMEAAYGFKRVLRGVPALRISEVEAPDGTRFAAQFPMSGTHALADVTLLPPRFTADFVVPAEAGGAKTIAR